MNKLIPTGISTSPCSHSQRLDSYNVLKPDTRLAHEVVRTKPLGGEPRTDGRELGSHASAELGLSLKTRMETHMSLLPSKVAPRELELNLVLSLAEEHDQMSHHVAVHVRDEGLVVPLVLPFAELA